MWAGCPGFSFKRGPIPVVPRTKQEPVCQLGVYVNEGSLCSEPGSPGRRMPGYQDSMRAHGQPDAAFCYARKGS